MKSDPLRIGLVYGSTRAQRFCDTVAGWVRRQLDGRDDIQLILIDPRDVEESDGEAVAFRQRIADADAFIVVTPEYNHGYPAPLKALIDSFGEEWQAKPVAFVSYGGISGGLRAVEQLRLVFAELHATTIRDSVSFPNAHEQFEAGEARDGERAARSLSKMLAALSWWAAVLRYGRRVAPYSERAA